MFNSSKYTKKYFIIIENAKNKKRKKGCGDYYESHHIYPRSVGGNDEKENLVLLTAKEHFVVHHLLTKMCDDVKNHEKMIHAFWRMCHAPQQKQKVSAKVYENLRLERSEQLSKKMMGENNHFYGKKHSLESKNKMKKSAAGRNPHDYYKGKTYPAWNKGVTKEDNKSVARMAESKKGNKNPMSGRKGEKHPNTNTFILFNENEEKVEIFHSRKEFSDFCRDNKYPFNGLYKTAKNKSFYLDQSKNHRYTSFNGWSLRILEK